MMLQCTAPLLNPQVGIRRGWAGVGVGAGAVCFVFGWAPERAGAPLKREPVAAVNRAAAEPPGGTREGGLMLVWARLWLD